VCVLDDLAVNTSVIAVLTGLIIMLPVIEAGRASASSSEALDPQTCSCSVAAALPSC
jgi:hypothetical protein